MDDIIKYINEYYNNRFLIIETRYTYINTPIYKFGKFYNRIVISIRDNIHNENHNLTLMFLSKEELIDKINNIISYNGR